MMIELTKRTETAGKYRTNLGKSKRGRCFAVLIGKRDAFHFPSGNQYLIM